MSPRASRSSSFLSFSWFTDVGVEEYVEALNGNVSCPYGDGADEADVWEIGDEILGMLVTGSPCRAFDSDGHPMIISIPLPED